jgi:hypothetical protein
VISRQIFLLLARKQWLLYFWRESRRFSEASQNMAGTSERTLLLSLFTTNLSTLYKIAIAQCRWNGSGVAMAASNTDS